MQEQSYWRTWQQARLSRRRVLSAAAAGGAGAAGVALLGCGSPAKQTSSSTSGAQATQAAAGPPKNGGQFNTALRTFAPLDPQKVSASPQEMISGSLSRVFQYQTGLDPTVIEDHNPIPDIGLSAESPDAVTWTVKLRPDAKFQNIAPVNGHAVEAEDIKASFTRAIDPATSNPNRGNLVMIDPEQIQTPDAHTVVFKLKYAYAPFHKMLASSVYAWILPREAVAGDYDPVKTVIGSGPYTVETIQPSVEIAYKKWPEYWNKSIGHVDTIHLAFVPDPQQQMAQFAAGHLHDLTITTPDDVTAARQQNPKAQLIRADTGTPSPIYVQLGDPSSAFMDVRVRRAFSMALDRATMGKVLYNGQYQETTFVPAYLGKWSLKVNDLPPNIQQWYKFNLSEAKKLLAAAGHSDMQLKFVYLTGSAFGTPQWNRQCDTVRSMLEPLGVHTTALTQDYNKDFIDSGKGSRQGYFPADMILLEGVAPAYEAYEMLFNNFDSKSTSNAEHLKDPKLDDMLAKTLTMVSDADRQKATIEIESYMADQMFTIPTVGTYTWVFVQPEVQNYQYGTPLGYYTETYGKVWLRS